jgi:thiamine-monophosphate kinase
VFVSGTLGDARAGLDILRAGAVHAHSADSLVARYLLPEPRVRLGTLLGRGQAATAAIDLSDGLADGLAQLAAASGVGLDVESAALPLTDAMRAAGLARNLDPVCEAVAGGDDYELLFTVHPRRVARLRAVQRLIGDLRLTRIGVATRAPGVWLTRDGVREPIGPGYAHFS